MARGERKIASLFFLLEMRTKGLDNQIRDAEKSLGRLGNFIGKHPVAAAASLGAALAGVAIEAVHMAQEVDGSIRKIGASLPQAVTHVKALRDEIERLSEATGRSQAEIARSMVDVARGGVGGLGDLVKQTRAAALAADATGDDLTAVVQGLDQSLDLFGKSGAEAERVLAKLFVTAQGHTNLTDLFAVLDGAAPVIEKTKVDFDTLIAAIAALQDRGFKGKKLLAELNALDLDGIRQLATEATKSSDGLEEMRAAAERARNELPTLGARIKQHLNAALIELGNELKPVIEGLARILGLTNDIADANDKRRRLAQAAFNGPSQFNQEIERQRREAPLENIPAGDSLSPNNRGRSTVRPPLPLTEEQKKALEELAAKALQLRQSLESTVASFTKTMVDDTFVALSHFQQEFEKQAAAAGGDVQANFDRIVADFKKRIEDLQVLENTTVTPAVVDTRVRTADEITDTETLIENAERLNDQFKQLPGIINDQVAALDREGQKLDDNREKEEGIRNAARLAVLERVRTFDQAARGALDLADAIGIVDDKSRQALESIVQIGSALAGAVDEAGKFHLDLSSALSIAGAAATLIGSLFSGPSPEELHRAQVLQDNTDAILELTQSIGDLGVLSDVAGSTILGVQQASEKTVQKTFAGAPVGLTAEATLPFLRKELAKLGLSMHDLKEVAAGLGISFAGATPTGLELKQLIDQIAAADITRFADTFAGQMQAFQDEMDLFDITDPIQQLEKLREIFSREGFGDPGIARQLGAFDLTSAEGRAAAEKFVQDLFLRLNKGLGEGGLTKGELGGLSVDEFRDFLKRFEGLIDQAGQGADAGGSSTSFQFQNQITEDTGRQISGLLLSQFEVQREIAGSAKGILDFLLGAGTGSTASNAGPAGTAAAVVVPEILPPAIEQILQEILDALTHGGPVAPPSISPDMFASLIGRGPIGPLIVEKVELTVTVSGAVDRETAQDLGALIGRGVQSSLDDQLGEALRKRIMYSGSSRFVALR